MLDILYGALIVVAVLFLGAPLCYMILLGCIYLTKAIIIDIKRFIVNCKVRKLDHKIMKQKLELEEKMLNIFGSKERMIELQKLGKRRQFFRELEQLTGKNFQTDKAPTTIYDYQITKDFKCISEHQLSNEELDYAKQLANYIKNCLKLEEERKNGTKYSNKNQRHK